jgi:putative transcriptional regulator
MPSRTEDDIQINVGDMLLAEPFMLDGNFRRSAIVITEHDDTKGTVGFVINKPIDMQINDLIADFPDFDSQVFFGGPVATDTIHYLHSAGDILDDSSQVVPGVFWGGNFEKLKFLIRSELIKPESIRFFVGYSGWSEFQLKAEMESGSWIKTDMFANYLWKSKPKKLWGDVLGHKGDTYGVIGQMPDQIRYN